MISVEEITSAKSFKTWLAQEQLSPKALSALQHRMAMRLLPIYWNAVSDRQRAGPFHNAIIPALRANLTSGASIFQVGAKGSDFNLKWAVSAIRKNLPDPSGRLDGPPDHLLDILNISKVTELSLDGGHSSESASHLAFDIGVAGPNFADLMVQAVQSDCGIAGDAKQLVKAPLWHEIPVPGEVQWDAIQRRYGDMVEYRFWVDWYQRALDGAEDRWDLLWDISLIEEDEFGGDYWLLPEALAAEIARREGEYAARGAGSGDGELSNAPRPADLAVAEFTFETLHHWMQAVGFKGDLAHIRDPSLVQKFNDEVGELRVSLHDIMDFGADLTGPTNQPAYLSTLVSKILREIDGARQNGHIRARRIVKLGRDMEDFLNNEAALEEIKDGLARQTNDATKVLKGICRTHFAPRLVVMDALDGIEMEGAEPDEVIALLETALRRIESADGTFFAPLRPEDMAMLRDMLNELRDIDASIGEARTEKHRERQKNKFANRAAEMTATVGGYAREAVKHGRTVGTVIDEGRKWHTRWKTLAPVVKYLIDLIARWPGGSP